MIQTSFLSCKGGVERWTGNLLPFEADLQLLSIAEMAGGLADLVAHIMVSQKGRDAG